MIKIHVAILSLVTLFSVHVMAQDTLPRFTVVGKPNDRNVISWTNPYRSISQISIQRSSDSLRNFITILSVPDPTVVQNGFVDAKASMPKMFYRLFIVLDSGKYVFTNSKRPGPDNGAPEFEPIVKSDNQRVRLSDSLTTSEVRTLNEKKTERFFVVKRNGIYRSISDSNFKKFRDSVINVTKDTLEFTSVDTVLVKPYIAKDLYKASKYVYTEKYGNVMITLPDAGRKKYSVVFFEENKTPVFEIKEVKSTSLIIDKTNFVHSGWFWFELYEEGALKEKHRLFIPKDF